MALKPKKAEATFVVPGVAKHYLHVSCDCDGKIDVYCTPGEVGAPEPGQRLCLFCQRRVAGGIADLLRPRAKKEES